MHTRCFPMLFLSYNNFMTFFLFYLSNINNKNYNSFFFLHLTENIWLFHKVMWHDGTTVYCTVQSFKRSAVIRLWISFFMIQFELTSFCISWNIFSNSFVEIQYSRVHNTRRVHGHRWVTQGVIWHTSRAQRHRWVKLNNTAEPSSATPLSQAKQHRWVKLSDTAESSSVTQLSQAQWHSWVKLSDTAESSSSADICTG